jgi:hypothetical protein
MCKYLPFGGIDMLKYAHCFIFVLDIQNKKWRDFSNKPQPGMGVYSVSNYFFSNTSNGLRKIFSEDTAFSGITGFSNECLRLSEQRIKDWKLMYNDLLQQGEYCLINIPGYHYPCEGSRESAYAIVNRIFKTQVQLMRGIGISEYAELVEKIFELRFGTKPQDYDSNKAADYLFPGPVFAKTDHYRPAGTLSARTSNTIQTEITVQEDLSAFKLDPAVKYFVVHSTAATEKSTLNEIEPYRNIINHTFESGGKGHAYIFKDGSIIILVPYTEKTWATKAERKENHHVLAWGACIHIELVYPEDAVPTEKQYQELAKLYYLFYKANNRKLIIVSHLEMDRGIKEGHSDPTNFNFNIFYDIIRKTYSIDIIAGTDGITNERHNKSLNQEDMINSYPPVLSGPIRRHN